MEFKIDHDLHIHSYLSACSKDPEQTPELILRYAQHNGLRTICLTNHFWDDAVDGASEWYAPQHYQHLAQAKPLPQTEGVRFLFGCETELDMNLTLGLSPEKYDLFDFIIIPTTHMHFQGFTLSEADSANAQTRAAAWLRRFDAVLHMDLPFYKVGLAHLTSTHVAFDREARLKVLRALPEGELRRLFLRAAKLGVGIELNAGDMNCAPEEADTVLRIYRIAKSQGCKFYMGTDAHSHTCTDTAAWQYGAVCRR